MKIVWARHPHPNNFHRENLGIFGKLLINVKREQSGFNRRMFNEDFMRIFLFSDRGDRNLFNITSNDDELKARLLECVRTRYELHPVNDVIKRMVGNIAESLLWFGDSYYFVTDDLKREKVYISSLAADRTFHFFGVYFQFFPKRHERHLNTVDQEPQREFRILDRSKLMHFRCPRSIKRMLSAQNAILASIDNHENSAADFFPHATHEDPSPQCDFDFRKWRDTQDHALYRATRETGWNCRKYYSSKTSDFFDCHRLIRFRRNQLKLRDGILEQLSSEFTRVGKQYRTGFHFAVTPTNALPSVADLDKLEARLSREEAGLAEVKDFCLGH